jgi:cytochrome b pre-mRNA-processing protein 3
MPGTQEQQAGQDICRMAFSFLKKIFARDEGRHALSPLYNAVVAEARNPVWYLEGKLPDTIDHRFEMVAALTALAILRLDLSGGDGKRSAVMLTELFVDDMDGQLRQEGMGDLVVGKHIGKMMASLGGRIAAYRDGLEGDGLDEALVRNLYRGEHPGDAPLAFTAARLRQIWAQLASRPDDALLSGQFS